MKKLKSAPRRSVSHLKELCDYQAELINKMEAKIDEARKIESELTKLRTVTIPEVASEVGLSEFKTTSGYKVSIKNEIRANISQANAPAAHAYMNDNGYGSLIKDSVTIKLDALDSDQKKMVADFLRIHKLEFDSKRSVHYQTLQSFVKELLREGATFDKRTFGVFETRACVIDKLKVPKLK